MRSEQLRQCVKIPQILLTTMANMIDEMMPIACDGAPRKIPTDICLLCVLFVLNSGIPWRYLMLDGVTWHTVYKRFTMWETKKSI